MHQITNIDDLYDLLSLDSGFHEVLCETSLDQFSSLYENQDLSYSEMTDLFNAEETISQALENDPDFQYDFADFVEERLTVRELKNIYNAAGKRLQENFQNLFSAMFPE